GLFAGSGFGSNQVGTGYTGLPFNLQLMSWGDGSGVPNAGSDFVIVGTDNSNLLHIRIFGASGNLVTDTDETKLPAAQAAAIATLKQQLPGLLPPHELTDAERAAVLRQVIAIVDQTPGLSDPAAPSGWYGIQGQIGDVRVWNVARSADDVRRDMTTVLTGTEP